MKLLVRSIFQLLVGIIFCNSSIANANCFNDTLESNAEGEYLRTLSGHVFETMAGDSITAMLWLPSSSLIICGPTIFSYKGKSYQIYQISNTDDGEMVSALKLGGRAQSSSSPCYESSIVKPTPFMGNDGEVFQLSDGTLWEIQYEYEYMYEYYPSVTICPSSGYVIVDGKKLNIIPLR